MPTKEEKTIALDFIKFSLKNNVTTSSVLDEDTLHTLFISYQHDHPSSVQISELVNILKESCLIYEGPMNKNRTFNLSRGIEDFHTPRVRVRKENEHPAHLRSPKTESHAIQKCVPKIHSSSSNTRVPEGEKMKRMKYLQRQYRYKKNAFVKNLKFLESEQISENIYELHQKKNYLLHIKNTSESPLKICFLDVFCLEFTDFVNLSYISGKCINNGESFQIMLSVSFKNYGFYLCPIVVDLMITTDNADDNETFELLLQPTFNVITKQLLEMVPREQYKHASKPIQFNSLNIVYGDPLPSRNLLANLLKLKNYMIPSTLKGVLRKEFDASKMFPCDETELRKLREVLCDKKFETILHNRVALNERNYIARFQLLMWLEEYELENKLSKYNKLGVKIKYNKSTELFELNVPGLAEGRPSLMKGDKIYVHQNGAKKKYGGVIHNIEEERILLSFNNELKENFLYALPLNVEFSLSRADLRLCHRALEQIIQRRLTSVMFPKQPKSSPKVDKIKIKRFFNEKIVNNEEQVRAIKNIIMRSASTAPYILFGPPGTGKTATIVEAITQIWHKYKRSKKICICAPSNSAADLIAMRLIEYKIPVFEIIRLYAMSRSDGEIPDILKKCSNYDRLINEVYFPSKEAIKFKSVVILTPVTAGRLVSGGFMGGHFDYLFMDEAGHAIEPEMIIPIIGLMSREGEKRNKPSCIKGCIILAGDPKQLGPIIQSKLAIKIGLDISLLERLMSQCEVYQKNEQTHEYNPAYITKLVKNYRSHEKILEIPNKLFYENELEACGDGDQINRALNWEGLVKRGFPIIFHSIKGKETRKSNSPSYFNVHEIQVVEDYLKKLVGRPLGNHLVQEKDIGIISPYRKQVQQIKERVKKFDWFDISVASVEEFQGQERLVIIISTVRSQPNLIGHDNQFGLGFLRNAKRFNVAITRAIALLIIVGNPDILLCDPNWRSLINYCISNGAFTGSEPSNEVTDDFEPQERSVRTYSALTISASTNVTK